MQTHIVILSERETDWIITTESVSVCVCEEGTRWEGQAETPRGFQDPKHEVKHGPLGWTALLCAGTHTHTQRKIRTGMLRNASAHVKRGHRQCAHTHSGE